MVFVAMGDDDPVDVRWLLTHGLQKALQHLEVTVTASIDERGLVAEH